MRTACLFFLLLGLVCLAASPAAAQVTLSGTVVDAETGEPLAGASVFLANTLIGAATDQDGVFSLIDVPLGTHELVASFVGYQTQAERLRLTRAEARTIDFRLAPRIVETGDIEVTATSPKQWQRDFKRFNKFFLGVSRNASKTEILNPDVLEFDLDEETGTFTAQASEPLRIANKALGYYLHFVLDDFQLQEKKRIIRYRGRVGFTEMEPRDDRERKRWKKRRDDAYNGSLRHFLASLVRDELSDEGFMLVSEEESREASYSGVPGNRPVARVNNIDPETILAAGELPFERKLDFSGYLKVFYFKEVPSGAYLKFREYANRGMQASEDEQISWISLNHPGVVITTDGLVADTYALTKFGYWYFERVAEMLPDEYRPPGFQDLSPALPEADPATTILRPAFVSGVEAVRAEAYDEAIAHLAPVVAADPSFSPGEDGAAAYWLGAAYAAKRQPALAQVSWRDGIEALRAKNRVEIRMADAYARSVYEQERKEAYEPAAQAYLDVLDQADSVHTEADREIVLRHVAQMLPLLTDDERKQAVGSRDPGPLLQQLQLEPGGGAFLATWWRTQDPLPASALNERVAEHLARVAHSMKNYAFSGSREGYDDRGQAYVQFGPPFTKLTIPVDLARASQIIRENGYTLPGAMVPTVNEFWTYRHVDELIYYLFVQKGGRYQEGSPEDLVPRELRNAHKRVGVGHADPRTASNLDGTQAPANQTLAEALYEVWKRVYTQLAIYHPAFEKQLEELEYHEADLRATRTGGAGLTASALSFVNSVDLKFTTLAREATQLRETEAPRKHSLIEDALETFPVAARIARFLDADGSTRTEVFWSHEPGSLALSKKQRKAVSPDEDAPPDRYLVEMVVNQHSADYRHRTPRTLNYLAADLPEGAAAPVQTLEIAGTTAPYHLSIQWDQFLVKIDEATSAVDQGVYLQTGLKRLDGLAPLRSNPQTLELSDLKPIHLDANTATLVLDEGDEAEALTPYPFAALTPQTPLGLYFEVYHLAFGEDDQTRYTIEYEVVRDPETRHITQTSAQSSYTGSSRTLEEYITLDLSEVGAARRLGIVVRVTDEVTGRTVERTVAFDWNG